MAFFSMRNRALTAKTVRATDASVVPSVPSISVSREPASVFIRYATMVSAGSPITVSSSISAASMRTMDVAV